MIDIYHSRRGMFKVCLWFKPDDSISNLNLLVSNKKPEGEFYARPSNSKTNQANVLNGAMKFQSNIITIETNDTIDDLTIDCVVLYNGKPWIVDSVQREIHNEESEFNTEDEFKTYISLRG